MRPVGPARAAPAVRMAFAAAAVNGRPGTIAPRLSGRMRSESAMVNSTASQIIGCHPGRPAPDLIRGRSRLCRRRRAGTQRAATQVAPWVPARATLARQARSCRLAGMTLLYNAVELTGIALRHACHTVNADAHSH